MAQTASNPILDALLKDRDVSEEPTREDELREVTEGRQGQSLILEAILEHGGIQSSLSA